VVTTTRGSSPSSSTISSTVVTDPAADVAVNPISNGDDHVVSEPETPTADSVLDTEDVVVEIHK